MCIHCLLNLNSLRSRLLKYQAHSSQEKGMGGREEGRKEGREGKRIQRPYRHHTWLASLSSVTVNCLRSMLNDPVVVVFLPLLYADFHQSPVRHRLVIGKMRVRYEEKSAKLQWWWLLQVWRINSGFENMDDFIQPVPQLCRTGPVHCTKDWSSPSLCAFFIGLWLSLLPNELLESCCNRFRVLSVRVSTIYSHRIDIIKEFSLDISLLSHAVMGL